MLTNELEEAKCMLTFHMSSTKSAKSHVKPPQPHIANEFILVFMLAKLGNRE